MRFQLNAHSSRSHAILCVKVSITTGEQTRTSTASAIDLAGSEDNRRTENSKERLVESSSINKSLFVLAQCVEAISKRAPRIPYRESKMTRILSLGQNNGLTIMILNLASVRSYHLDTLSSLNFANRTKKIEVREVENEAVFAYARPAHASTNLHRQPLRALTSATHNANVRKLTDVVSTKVPTKPKLFTVYADTSRNSLGASKAPKAKHSSPLKRPSDANDCSRPSKLVRPSHVTRPQPAMSQADIENMVERKVREALTARALEAPAAAPPPLSEEVQRRLAVLEQRVEDHDDDARAEGLHFLLMAKQHHARGEDGSALRMYEMARQHFPGNAKLEAKIERLKAKVQAKRDGASSEADSGPALPALDVDPDYVANPCEDADYDSEAGTRYKTKIRSKSLAPTAFDDGPPTPRTKHLLAIVNSRDAGRIRELKGVGTKKAEALVAALAEAPDVVSLAALSALKGAGVRAVEVMRAGIVV